MYYTQGLRTPNEGINQRYLKNWANVEEKNASAIPKNLGVGVNFRQCSEGCFLSGSTTLWASVVHRFELGMVRC